MLWLWDETCSYRACSHHATDNTLRCILLSLALGDCHGVVLLFPQCNHSMHCTQLSSKAHLTNVSAFRATTSSSVSRPVRVLVPVIENRVAIRFQRFGRHKAPFYRVVAVDSKQRRDYGEPLEYLGWYDPLKKETNLNGPSIRKWLTQGAQPSDTVRDLLKKAFIIEPTETKYDKRKTRAFRALGEPAEVAAE
jgi:small subunit ribosomal protein S16